MKSNNVISGGVYLGNDTSHDRQGDFFARNRVLSVMRSFCRKRPLAFFDKLSNRACVWARLLFFGERADQRLSRLLTMR